MIFTDIEKHNSIFKCAVLFGMLLLAGSGISAKSVYINEIVASNKSGLTDVDGQCSDWIELYNSSSESVSLEGWSLTDSRKIDKRWVFPEVVINPKSYLIVFASEKDRAFKNVQLHTNFKLDGDGEYLALIDNEGNIVDEFAPFLSMSDNHSAGLFGGCWANFKIPSPGQANSINSLESLPAPVFSMNHGVFEKAFNLTLTNPVDFASIYYTTDGSRPTVNNGTLYTGEIPVDKTTIVRAVAVPKGDNPFMVKESPVSTRSYIFLMSIYRQPSNPSGYPTEWGKYAQMSGKAKADYEMDPELIAENLYKDKIRKAIYEIPIVSIVTDKKFLFNPVADPDSGGIYIFTAPPVGDNTGLDWERPASFEYFHAASNVSLQADCGLSLHGGHSRLPEKSPKHSFRLDFQDDYGPNKLYYPLFGKDKAQDINSFFLRAGFGNTWIHQSETERQQAIYTRDAWAKRTKEAMGHFSSNSNYAHLFLNGLYWGLYNPNERINDEYLAQYLGGKSEDWDVIKEEEGSGVAATDGNITAWKKLHALSDTIVKNPTDSVTYKLITGKNFDGSTDNSVQALLDVDDFIDYMLLNFYGSNSDWDHHNWIAVRNRVNPESGFKMMCWDSEHIIKTLGSNNISLINKSCPTYIYQNLKNNPLFKREIGDKVQKNCFNGGALTPEVTSSTWKSLADVIDNSLYAESARWGDYRKDVHPIPSAGKLCRKETFYDTRAAYMQDEYFPKRTDEFVSQMRKAGLFPSVDAPVFKVNGNAISTGVINKGDVITISSSAGKTYYTIDGKDPVDMYQNGVEAISKTAKRYVSQINPENSFCLKARTLSDNVWSALNEKWFTLKDTTINSIGTTDALSDIKLANYPNPFTASTNIFYSIPHDSYVKIELYDLSGRNLITLASENQQMGAHEIVLDGSELKQGTYICRLTVDGRQKVLRIVHL
jgi:hypothetical protein